MRYGVHNICPRRPAVTLTFDLQKLIRLSVGADEFSLQVSSRLLKLVRYRGIKICPDERTRQKRGKKQCLRRHCQLIKAQ